METSIRKKNRNRTLSVRKEHKMLIKREIAGRTGKFAKDKKTPQKNDSTATRVVKIIGKLIMKAAKFVAGFKRMTSQKCAREIMGRNMFGIEEAAKYYGINCTRRQAVALSRIPFSKATLERCRETHVLVAVFPLSIMEIIESKTELFYCRSWYNEEAFANDRGKAEWHLILKTPVDDSIGKTWKEQLSLLSSDSEIPTARVITYAIIGHFLSTGERLFENIYVRCSNKVSDGYCSVEVGDFGEIISDFGDVKNPKAENIKAKDIKAEGLSINLSWDDIPYGYLGVASTLKHE